MSETVLVDEIDETILEEGRRWIGVELRLRPGQTEASFDNVRWFAWGIGDSNPLWVDPEYGRRSPFGANIAPPTFLHSVYFGGILPGLGELYTVNAGNRWIRHEAVRVGDRGLHATAHVASVEMVTSSRGITRLLSTGHADYFRTDEAGRAIKIAEFEPRYWRMATGSGRGLRYEPRATTKWSVDELVKLGKEIIASNVRRGAEPRYWDSVNAGDSLGTLIRGPYSLMDQVSYYAGERYKVPRAYDSWWLHVDDDPASFPNDMPTLPPGVNRGGHFDVDAAHEAGMPGAYDDGFQRTAVVASIVTNWIGDYGFIHELDVRHSKPVIPGDALWISGEVRERLDEEGRPGPGHSRTKTVKIGLQAKNQLDQVVSSGTAIVDLPIRQKS